MALHQTRKYDDILDCSRPESRRARMSEHDRAAQFSPFAALTGYDAVIQETARLTEGRIELSEGEQAALDAVLREILAHIAAQPRICATWFVRDPRKDGGAYVTATGCVKKIDSYHSRILLTDGTAIPICEIVQLNAEEV